MHEIDTWKTSLGCILYRDGAETEFEQFCFKKLAKAIPTCNVIENNRTKTPINAVVVTSEHLFVGNLEKKMWGIADEKPDLQDRILESCELRDCKVTLTVDHVALIVDDAALGDDDAAITVNNHTLSIWLPGEDEEEPVAMSVPR